MKNKNVLLIDDDADDQLFFRDALKEHENPVHCVVASNGREALEKLEVPPPPDLIFLDLNMPMMNGFECLRILKKENRYKNIPVIIFTTSSDPATIKQTHQLGASAFFRKPVDFNQLCKKVHKVLNIDFSLRANSLAEFAI